jgi:hypothetical protein
MYFTDAELADNKQAHDAKALLSLLNENCHTNIKMDFSKARAGRANAVNTHFTIPKHAFTKGETYLFYYVIHEFTHCETANGTHNAFFKRCEQRFLAMFDITIKYAKAYPRTLYANGEPAYQKKSKA